MCKDFTTFLATAPKVDLVLERTHLVYDSRRPHVETQYRTQVETQYINVRWRADDQYVFLKSNDRTAIFPPLTTNMMDKVVAYACIGTNHWSIAARPASALFTWYDMDSFSKRKPIEIWEIINLSLYVPPRAVKILGGKWQWQCPKELSNHPLVAFNHAGTATFNDNGLLLQMDDVISSPTNSTLSRGIHLEYEYASDRPDVPPWFPVQVRQVLRDGRILSWRVLKMSLVAEDFSAADADPHRYVGPDHKISQVFYRNGVGHALLKDGRLVNQETLGLAASRLKDNRPRFAYYVAALIILVTPVLLLRRAVISNRPKANNNKSI
jgi:hypothetical protein